MSDDDKVPAIVKQNIEQYGIYRVLYGEAFANSGFGLSLLVVDNHHVNFFTLPEGQ